ncbi:MAG: hypothetical protein ACEB74_08745 [Desulfovibrio aminophilus]|jgi:hypothetical protein|uniref:hypothetical protein n=1 Tax=Desulfovibrio aminophilus TaxID=81425 RepID=UPI00040DF79C|nr:hypothetical protein [Desulfovibrio aminophilus]MDY0307794.1 hypothetical protein [Desulfovibrionaceae bacterium]
MRRFLRLPLLSLLLLLAACAGRRDEPPVIDLLAFRPAPGATFNLQVRDYQLGELGTAVPVDGEVVELERDAIRTLEALGYRYQPDGRPDYVVRAYLLCVNARQVARLAESGLPMPPFDDDFLPWAGDIHVWSPALAAAANAPESCQGEMLLLVQGATQGADQRPYGIEARVHPCPFDMDCPFDQCAPLLRTTLLGTLQSAFGGL